jgi:hypothetical protein
MAKNQAEVFSDLQTVENRRITISACRRAKRSRRASEWRESQARLAIIKISSRPKLALSIRGKPSFLSGYVYRAFPPLIDRRQFLPNGR